MSNTNSTDDLHTYNDHGVTYAPATTCKCMYHHGEFDQTTCFDSDITKSNRATLAEVQLERRIESAQCEYDDYRGKWVNHSILNGQCWQCECSTRSLAYALGCDV